MVNSIFFAFSRKSFWTHPSLEVKVTLRYYTQYLIFNPHTLNIHDNVFLSAHINSNHLITKAADTVEILIVHLNHAVEQLVTLCGDLPHVTGRIFNNLKNLIVILLVLNDRGVPSTVEQHLKSLFLNYDVFICVHVLLILRN